MLFRACDTWRMAISRVAIASKLRELRRLFWQDLDPLVQTTALILLATGFILLLLGVLADATGFWGDASFTPNIFSALASACFGIPLALVVLRYVIDQQEEHSAKRAARRMALSTVDRMTLLASSIIHDQKLFEQGAAEIKECAWWKSRMDSTVWPSDWKMRYLAHVPGTTSAKSRALLVEKLKEWMPRCLQAHEIFEQSLPPHPDRLPMYQELELNWRYLDEAVRPRLLENGLPWLDPETATKGRTLRWDPFPVAERGRLDQSSFMHLNLSLGIAHDMPIEALRDWAFALVDASTAGYYGIRDIQDFVAQIEMQLKAEGQAP